MDFGAWPLVGDALQGLGQPRDGVDVVHLTGLQEGGDSGPCATSAIRSGEQAVFSRDCLGSDGALDNVGIELNAAIR